MKKSVFFIIAAAIFTAFCSINANTASRSNNLAGDIPVVINPPVKTDSPTPTTITIKIPTPTKLS